MRHLPPSPSKTPNTSTVTQTTRNPAQQHVRVRATLSKPPHPGRQHQRIAATNRACTAQGPPPPQVPAGWKAIWNDQYQAWFYANTVTKETTWEMPTQPAYAPGEAPPPGAPPGYDHGSSTGAPPEKSAAFASNNPYGQSPGPANQQYESDEAMARRLQQQEQAGGSAAHRGASDNFYGGPPQQQYGAGSPGPYGQNQLPPRQESGKKGLFSKISSKLSGGGSRPPQQYMGGGYPQQGHYGGGYPQQGYGGGYPMGGHHGGMYGGYPQQGMYGPPRRHGGGLGAGGGAALGLGAGMMGGMMVGGMMANDHDEQEAYQDG